MPRILLFFFLSIVFFSCKKDVDSTPPIVTISSPSEGSRFQVLDQITLSATATDNEQITVMRSYLMYSDGRTIALNGPSNGTVAPQVNLQANLVLSDSLLPTANYFIRVDAEDGDNINSAFRSIQIEGIPRRKLSLMVVSHELLNANLWEDKNDLTFQLQRTFDRYHNKSIFLNEKQQLWTAESDGYKLKVTQIKDNELLLDKRLQQNSAIPFEAITTDGSTIYYATKEEMMAYNTSISKRFSIYPSQNRKFGKVYSGERYLLLEELDLTNTNRHLRILFNDNGAQFGSVNLAIASEEIFFTNRTDALIFSNKNGNGFIQELNIEKTQLSELINLNDSIIRVISMPDNHFLISTDKGVFEYDYARQSITAKVSTTHAVMAFDEVNQEVVIGKDKIIWTYAYPSFQLLKTGNCPELVKQLIVRYNY